MVNLGSSLKPILLINPIYLLLLAPHYVPIITVSLSPLSVAEPTVHTVAEGGLELDVLAQ